MGKISKGILGGVSGKIGNVVGASWIGIDYLRSMPASVANPQTAAQVAQRYKFSTVLNFLQPLLSIVKVGYSAYRDKMSAFNAAFSNTIRFAVTGVSPNYTIDYPNVLLSRGNLEMASNGSVASAAPATVTFTWDPTLIGYLAADTDEVLAVVYNPTKGQAAYSLNQAVRSAGTLAVDVPAMYTGDTVKCYLIFQAAGTSQLAPDRNSISQSLFVGSVVVS